jgi:hypothetical protein
VGSNQKEFNADFYFQRLYEPKRPCLECGKIPHARYYEEQKKRWVNKHTRLVKNEDLKSRIKGKVYETNYHYEYFQEEKPLTGKAPKV